MWWLDSQKVKVKPVRPLKAKPKSCTRSFLSCPTGQSKSSGPPRREGEGFHLPMVSTACMEQRDYSSQLCKTSVYYTYNSNRYHETTSEDKTASKWEDGRSKVQQVSQQDSDQGNRNLSVSRRKCNQ